MDLGSRFEPAILASVSTAIEGARATTPGFETFAVHGVNGFEVYALDSGGVRLLGKVEQTGIVDFGWLGNHMLTVEQGAARVSVWRMDGRGGVEQVGSMAVPPGWRALLPLGGMHLQAGRFLAWAREGLSVHAFEAQFVDDAAAAGSAGSWIGPA